jgi:hypothetical protein
MHVVVELPGFVAAVRAADLPDRERARIIDRIATRPDAGDVIRERAARARSDSADAARGRAAAIG